MILPIGHEEGSVRRWPVVTTLLIAVCLVVHLQVGDTDPEVEARVEEVGYRALEYWSERPWLELDPDLESRYGSVVELVRHNESVDSGSAVRPPPGEIERQQGILDEIVGEWTFLRQALPFVRYGLIPNRFEVGDLLTSMFLHADWLHLVSNMIFLWMVGPALEDIWGRLAFGLFYVAAGVVAGMAWVWIYPDSAIPLIGASGAIAGLMGAFALRFWSSKIFFVYAFFFFPFVFRTGTFSAPAWMMLGLWAVREVFFGSVSGAGGEVAHWVHVAGFGAGVAGAFVLGKIDLESHVERSLGDPDAEIRNEVLEQVHELRGTKRVEEAWELLRAEARASNPDLAVALWDLAIDLGRADEVAPTMLDLIRFELRQDEEELALRHWWELREQVRSVEAPADLRVRLAEAMVRWQLDRQAVDLLAELENDLSDAAPPGLLLKAAAAACEACSESAPALVALALSREEIPADQKEDLESRLARTKSRGLVAARRDGIALGPDADRPAWMEAEPLATGSRAEESADPAADETPAAVDPAPVEPGAGEPAPAEPSPVESPRALRVLPARLLDRQGDCLTLSFDRVGAKRLPLSRIVGFALVEIHEENDRFLDLALDPLDAEKVRLARLRESQFEPEAVWPGFPGRNLGDLLRELASGTRAKILCGSPDDEVPTPAFPDLAAYRRSVYGVDRDRIGEGAPS